MGTVADIAREVSVHPGPAASCDGVSIVIPAFNESDGIGPTLAELLTTLDGFDPPIETEVIVVDDGSTDDTAQQAERFAGERLRVLRHPKNHGYGAAIKTGLHSARHPWIAILDADGTYPPRHLEKLLRLRAEHDMVVGARAGSQISLLRRPPKWALRRLACYMAQRSIPDLNSGLRVMRRSVVRRYERILPNQFSFTTTVTLAMLSGGYSVHYETVEYLKRKGSSKISPIADTLRFLALIIRTIMFFDPLRVFVPLSIVFFVASVGVGVGTYLLGRFMDVTTMLLFVTSVQLLAVGMLADLINRKL